jgi:hypothetical protein
VATIHFQMFCGDFRFHRVGQVRTTTCFVPWASGDNQQLLLVPVQLEGYGISARDKYIMWLITSPWRKSLSTPVFRILFIPWRRRLMLCCCCQVSCRRCCGSDGRYSNVYSGCELNRPHKNRRSNIPSSRALSREPINEEDEAAAHQCRRHLMN